MLDYFCLKIFTNEIRIRQIVVMKWNSQTIASKYFGWSDFFSEPKVALGKDPLYFNFLTPCKVNTILNSFLRRYVIGIFLLLKVLTEDCKYLMKSYDLDLGKSGEWKTISSGSMSYETKVSKYLVKSPTHRSRN